MKRILIVDDVATNRELIREALMCREYKSRKRLLVARHLK
jgi:CheY-like chemotaxis protein